MNKRILLIDDDDRLLTTTSMLLEYEGYDVFTHRSGFGATSKIVEVDPALILLDINMPGLSGEGLVEVIKSNSRVNPYTKIIFFSSNDEEDLRLSAERHGVAGYICKGDMFSLKTKLEMYLDGNGEKALAGA